MRLLGAFLWVVARIVPGASRGRWIEEWRAELAHGRRSMVAGSLPDAWALRRLRGNRPARREPLFHAFLQDIRYLGPVREQVCQSGRRGARMARREKRAYRAYVSDEQRRQAGCIGGQTGTLIHGRVLTAGIGRRGFVLGVVLSLSIGIGGNVVAFSFINQN